MVAATVVEELTQKELAKRLGLSARQVRNLHGHGIPRQESGRYPWPAARDWYVRFKQDEAKDRAGGKAPVTTYEEERARNYQLRNRALELDVAEREGRLIPADMHADRFAGFVDHVNGTLKSIRGRWAPMIIGVENVQEAQSRLRRLVNELLEELAATVPEDYTDEEDAAA